MIQRERQRNVAIILATFECSCNVAEYFLSEAVKVCCIGSAEAQRNMHRDVSKWILMLMSHMLKLLHWIMVRALQCDLKASTQMWNDVQSDLKACKNRRAVVFFVLACVCINVT